MNLKKYRVVGLGDPLDGLVVQIDEELYVNTPDDQVLYPIVRMEQGSKLFTNWSVPLQLNSLYVNANCLRSVPDEAVEFEVTNPYGKYISEHKRISPSGIELTWAIYEHALTVNLSQDGRTILSEVYHENRSDVDEFLFFRTKEGSYDFDDIVFDLKKMKSDVGYRREEIKLNGKEED